MMSKSAVRKIKWAVLGLTIVVVIAVIAWLAMTHNELAQIKLVLDKKMCVLVLLFKISPNSADSDWYFKRIMNAKDVSEDETIFGISFKKPTDARSGMYERISHHSVELFDAAILQKRGKSSEKRVTFSKYSKGSMGEKVDPYKEMLESPAFMLYLRESNIYIIVLKLVEGKFCEPDYFHLSNFSGRKPFAYKTDSHEIPEAYNDLFEEFTK